MNTDTPRTDAMDEHWRQLNFPPNPVPADFARQLERELADAKAYTQLLKNKLQWSGEQRDRLAEAARNLCLRILNPKAGRDLTPDINAVGEALAAVKESTTTTTP